ncbi:unnamed protein product, partial [Rotaria sp. Silwood2]
SRSTANATSTNDFKGYSRNSNDDNHYYKDHYSSNESDLQRYFNRISQSSSYNSYE